MGKGEDGKVPLNLIRFLRIYAKILQGKYTHKHSQCFYKFRAKKCKIWVEVFRKDTGLAGRKKRRKRC